MGVKDVYRVYKELGLKPNTELPQRGYEGVFSTGGFEGIGDYDAGVLGVRISYTKYNSGDVGYHPCVTIYTIDDGGWMATTPSPMSLEECTEVTQRVAEAWPWKTKLPTEKELNEFLQDFGMWGQLTG